MTSVLASSLIDPAWQVAHLPPWWARFDDEPEQLRSGAPGKVGVVRLAFEAGAARTILRSSLSAGPQRVGRALYPDPSLPAMAHCVIQSVSGGVLQGDRLAIEVTVRAGAIARVTTQSATKLYAMEHNYATLRVSFELEAGAYLEYVPGIQIPFRGARFYQETVASVASGGTLVVADLLTSGRIAYGEEHEYEALASRFEVRGYDGSLRLLDAQRNEPDTRDPRGAGTLGDARAWGSLYVVTDRVKAHVLADAINSAAEAGAVSFGVTTLPYGEGVVIRLVGDDAESVTEAVSRAVGVAREVVLGQLARIDAEHGPTE